MSSFLRLYLPAFLRPRASFDRLVREPARVRLGALAVGVTAVVYLLVYFFLSRNGGRPTVFKPWLAIPAEVYYRWDLYLCVPSIVLGWVAAAGFTQLAARGLGGAGSFEDTLAVLGFGIGIASWATGLHDVVTTFCGYLGVLDQRAYEDAMSTGGWPHTLIWTLMLLYMAWFLLLFSRGVAAAHRLRGPSAFACGVVGYVVYQGIFVLFNR